MSTVCEWFGLKTTRTVFVGLGLKLVATIFNGLASKSVVTVFCGLASKPVAIVFSSLTSKMVPTVSPGLTSKPAVGFLVEPQNQGGGGFPGLDLNQTGISDLGLKIIATVSWFMPQNQVRFDLSVAPQNRRGKVDAGHALRSTGLLRVEASLARVFQSGLKTGRDTMTGGACDTITEVASEVS
jgi:hypothetical protein